MKLVCNFRILWNYKNELYSECTTNRQCTSTLVSGMSPGNENQQSSCVDITKTRLFKYTENFTTKKMAIFQIKNSDIFYISAQNIDCGYSLEPPRRGGSNEYHNLCF